MDSFNVTTLCNVTPSGTSLVIQRKESEGLYNLTNSDRVFNKKWTGPLTQIKVFQIKQGGMWSGSPACRCPWAGRPCVCCCSRAWLASTSRCHGPSRCGWQHGLHGRFSHLDTNRDTLAHVIILMFSILCNLVQERKLLYHRKS